MTILFLNELNYIRFHWNTNIEIIRSFKMEEFMAKNNKMKSTKNNKKEDGTFHSKHIKHDPQAESARAVFGLNDDSRQRNK